jgi:hypothetical protein
VSSVTIVLLYGKTNSASTYATRQAAKRARKKSNDV